MSRRLPARILCAYALPAIGLAAMGWWIVLALLKYAGQELGVGPAALGAIFAVGRVWDAVSDPVVGWASDRTRGRFGRRRPWMLAGAAPAALAFVALWWAPVAMGTPALVWIGGSLFVYYAASTIIAVPHASLGAELSLDSHQRTRLFAARGGLEFIGVLLGAAALGWLEAAEDPRRAATSIAALFGSLLVVGVVLSVGVLREPAEHRDRFRANPWSAFRDVWRNEHARQLIAVFFFSELALSSLAAALPFASGVLGAEPDGGMAAVLVVFMLLVGGSIPMWVWLAGRFGKRRVWLLASALGTLGFAGLFVAGTGPQWALSLFGLCAAVTQGATRVLPHSVKADVIDVDEQRTGERKEGTYFAAWNLAQKTAAGASIAVTGMVLQLAGVGEEGASPDGIRFAIAGWPALLLAVSTLLLWRFRLDGADAASGNLQALPGAVVTSA